MRRSDRSDHGFTLIEVVIAMAILGSGFVILLETHYGSLRLFSSAQDEAIAASLLQSAVGQAEQAVLEGHTEGEGEFGARFPDYQYTFTATQPDKDNVPGLYKVVVTLRGPLDSDEVTFLVYDGNQVQLDGST